MVLKVQLSYDKSEEEALMGGHEQWKGNVFDSDMLTELRYPKQFEQAGKYVDPEEIKNSVNVSSDPERHIAWLEEYRELGFQELVLHNVNRKQEQFIQVFGEKVIPKLMG